MVTVVLCSWSGRPAGRPEPHSRGFYITHDASQSLGLLWTSDRLVAEISNLQDTTLTTNTHAPAGFEPAISAGEWPHTYALDRVATGTGST